MVFIPFWLGYRGIIMYKEKVITGCIFSRFLSKNSWLETGTIYHITPTLRFRIIHERNALVSFLGASNGIGQTAAGTKKGLPASGNPLILHGGRCGI
jgi:hypothetical protein